MATAPIIPAAIQCIIVTPEATALDTDADFVALPLYDGEFGVAPGHSPVIGRLGYGELRIRKSGETLRYYVDGGFVQIADNVVSVLTNRAIPAARIDASAAAEQLRSSQDRKAAGEEQLAIRERLLSQARGQLRVASRTR
ncbi:MAG: ATP synthase F1 subunit epsilon [Planctomycetes bacterium]|nr:ATP synthase F1 subunit epsilon [Planctomycetota bacterium]